MIRLAARQFRLQAAVAIGGLVAVAIVVLVTGPALAHLYDTTVVGCGARGDCQTATAGLLARDQFLKNALDALVLVVPALIGIFWGAPLIARELETGSFRLAWTQSVTRTRWLAVKLGVVGLSGIVVAGLLSLMVTWWFHPIDRVNADQYAWSVFEVRDLVPIGYAAFAFALAVAAGAVIRRTIPAMASTIVGFVAVRVAFAHLIRFHLLAPAHTTHSLGAANGLAADALGFQADASGQLTFVARASIPNALTMSTQLVDRAGHAPTVGALHAFLRRFCPDLTAPPARGGGGQRPAPGAFQDCVAQLSSRFHLAVTYQPASHYWSFQWLEMAIYVAAALILAGFTFWWVRHRVP